MGDVPHGRPAGRKAADVRVLRCLGPGCGGLLAYEVDAENVLYTDLAWTAHAAGDRRFFPCPKCGGKNLLEEVPAPDGRTRHRVTRWEP